MNSSSTATVEHVSKQHLRTRLTRTLHLGLTQAKVLREEVMLLGKYQDSNHFSKKVSFENNLKFQINLELKGRPVETILDFS